mmetsp:Transcript_16258/g.24792  ORF Transcript_16258/g.24792 Transcript_16258/m.24792 type:complete len:148 (+) Transcript_16258:252-695(+)
MGSDGERCGAVWSNTERCGAVRYGVERCGAMGSGAKRCEAVRCGAERCEAVQSGTERCGAVQSGAERCGTARSSVEQCGAREVGALASASGTVIDGPGLAHGSLGVRVGRRERWARQGRRRVLPSMDTSASVSRERGAATPPTRALG